MPAKTIFSVPLIVALTTIGFSAAAAESAVSSGNLSGKQVSSFVPSDKFADIASLKTGNISINLKYASSDNFMRTDMYKSVGLNRAYLSKECLPMLKGVADKLKDSDPNLNLVVYDSYRPLQAQQAMWDATKEKMGETEAKKYVSQPVMEDPSKVSMHNLGLAIDLSLETKNHEGLPMGTKFDDFQQASHIDEASESALDETARLNRKKLRDAMTAAGFKTYLNEWWHFNCFDRKDTTDRTRFPVQ